jgi:hypothetical protein
VGAYALFSDGTIAGLGLELDTGSEPKVFVLGSPSRELVMSAERGVTAAYFALRRKELIRQPYVCFFELGRTDGAVTILGESAGLCFAMAFAAQALLRERPGTAAISFAATGVVTTATAEAAVAPVDGIAAKVGAAAAGLPAGALVFVPAANAPDLSEAVRAELGAKGLRLVPVATVAEALATLTETVAGAGRAPRSGRRAWVVGALVAAVLVALAWTGLERAARERLAQLARQAPRGEFAALTAASPLAWLPLAPPGLASLEADARQELTLMLALHSRSTGPVPAAADGMPELAGGDRYRLALEVSRDCYFYAVQIDSWGNGTVLFPNPALSAATNPLRGGAHYWLPEGDRWLVLDEFPGKETVVVVAAPWAAEDIEALFAEVASAKGATAALFTAIWQRAALRKQAHLAGLRGIAYEEIVFAHR